MQTITHEIRQFVIDNYLFGRRGETLSDDSSLLEAGIIDSTGVLELVSFLEERYHIAISDDELVPENLDSIGRVAGFVNRKVHAGAVRLAG